MKKVLIVEDDPDIRVTIKDLLIHEGMEIKCANNGKTGLSIALEEEFDLIIADVYMPDMDGIELLTKLKKKIPDQKIIICSGGGSFSDAEPIMSSARYLGADEVVSKPFENEELLRLIKKII